MTPRFSSFLFISKKSINIVFRVFFRYCPGDRDYGSLHCSGKEAEVMVDGLGYLYEEWLKDLAYADFQRACALGDINGCQALY